jgi:hypothetical protein
MIFTETMRLFLTVDRFQYFIAYGTRIVAKTLPSEKDVVPGAKEIIPGLLQNQKMNASSGNIRRRICVDIDQGD